MLSLVLLPAAAVVADHPPAERMVVDDCFTQPPPAAAASVRGFVAYGGRWRATDGVLWGQGDGGSKLLLDQPLPADSEVVAEVLLAPHIQWSGLITCVSDPDVGADRFYLMPGETLSCVGCHENRTWAPPARGSLPLAARRAPSAPQKPAWAPDGIIDFVTVVQPVLDKHCARCHSGGNPDGGYDLSGDKTRLFNMAYDNLLGRSRSYRQHKMDTGEMLPEEVAQGKPLVHSTGCSRPRRR